MWQQGQREILAEGTADGDRTVSAFGHSEVLPRRCGVRHSTLYRVLEEADYHYAIQSIRVSGKAHSGVVAAYNMHEIKYVPVFWNE